MGRMRTLLVAASLTMAAAALGIVPAAAATGAVGATHGARAAATTGAGSTETTPACGTAPAGHATCLARVHHKVGSQATSSPTGYSPATIEKAYGFSGTDVGTGTGKTIAIVDAYDDPTVASNLSTFSSEYGLLACTTSNGCFSKVNQSGGTSYPATTSGWDVEISLDVEWAHAIAPRAHILLVEASSNSYTSLFTAVKYAEAHSQYVSMSWGGTEFSSEKTLDKDFTPTVSSFAAAGDSGSEVIYPSASPDVISVGGTTLTVESTGAFKAESAWSDGGGGCSKYETASTAQADFPTYDQTDASCSGKRATPDVALDANPDTGVSIYDSVADRTFGTPGWVVVGGTSVATPIWAAHSAAADDHVNATFVYGSNIRFYDITSGSNGHTCVEGYNLCDGLGSWNTSVGTVNGATTDSLRFTSTPITLKAGTSKELSVSLSNSQSSNVPVTLSSSSTGGEFSTEVTSGFTKTLALTVSGSTPEHFYYEDTVAGSPTLTASSPGWTSGTRTVTVTTTASTPKLAVSITAGSVTHSGRTYKVPLTVTATGTSGGVDGAKVTVDVYSGTCSGSLVASGSGTTGSSGSAGFTFSTSSTGTYCAKATATATGYTAGSGTATFGITASTRGVHP